MSTKKPITNNPIHTIALGLFTIIVAIILNAKFPGQMKVIESSYVSLTAPGALAACGIILAVWPIANRIIGYFKGKK